MPKFKSLNLAIFSSLVNKMAVGKHWKIIVSLALLFNGTEKWRVSLTTSLYHRPDHLYVPGHALTIHHYCPMKGKTTCRYFFSVFFFLLLSIERITLPEIIDTTINVKVHPSSPAASVMEIFIFFQIFFFSLRMK